MDFTMAYICLRTASALPPAGVRPYDLHTNLGPARAAGRPARATAFANRKWGGAHFEITKFQNICHMFKRTYIISRSDHQNSVFPNADNNTSSASCDMKH